MIAGAVIRRRRLVLLGLTAVALTLAAGLPGLRAVFAPDALVPPDPAHREVAEELLGGFAGREPPVVVLVGAPDVLERDALGALHRIARHLEGLDWVASVEGLTTTPLPTTGGDPDDDAALTLDALDGEADEIDGEADEAQARVARIVATDPGRFPMGLVSLEERSSVPRLVRPWVSGDEVTEAEARAIREGLAAAPWLRGKLVSADRCSAMLVVHPRGELSTDDVDAEIPALGAWLDAEAERSGVSAALAGLAEVRVSMVGALLRDQVVLVSLAILGSVLVLLVAFRSVHGVVLPLAAAGMTAGMVVGAMGWLGEPLNLLNNVVPALLITIGLGDAVHLLTRHREEIQRDGDAEAASVRTMRAMAHACLLTSATTAVGFASLAVSETAVVRRFGLLAAGGVMLAYAVTIVFLPAALLDYRVRVKPTSTFGLDRAIDRLVSRCLGAPKTVVAGAVLLLGLSLMVGRDVSLENALLDQVPPGSVSRQTAERLEEEFIGFRMMEVGLGGAPGTYHDPARVADLDRRARAWAEWPEVIAVEHPGALLAPVWVGLTGDPDAEADALANPERVAALIAWARAEDSTRWQQSVSPDGSRARVVLRVRDAGEGQLRMMAQRLEAELADVEGDSVVAGEAYASSQGLARMFRDLVSSLGLAVLVIFAMLGLTLGSVRLGLLSVLPNVLPLGVTVAMMTWRGIPMSASTAIVFSVSLGLAVDGTIHILARYGEEIGAGRTRPQAVRRAIRGSGRAVLIGAATLLVGFLALTQASFVPIRWFGELSIVAIGSSTLCEMVVLPAMLALWGPGADGESEGATRPSAAPLESDLG